MSAIDILMAAYNGEKYIAEQIESILAQTFTDWRLLIRDDGSSDNTPAIIEGYAAEYPGKIQVIHDNETCHSAVRNFFELLKHASADYVMFSDQDDYWLPYKIQITYDYMRKAESENPGLPVMVFTGLQVVDAELRSMDQLMGMEFPERARILSEFICNNRASGCTQMLNRKCYTGMGVFEESIIVHDRWASIYAAALGVVVQIPMGLILYRQHSDNVIGADNRIVKRAGYYAGKLCEYICHPALKISGRIDGMKQNIQTRRDFAYLFRSRYHDEIPHEKLRELDEYCEMFSKSIINRIRAYMKFRGLYYFSRDKGFNNTISKILWVIFGGQ